ncbi:nuclear transport factor 2 family protein [uncultured Jatrophihabitans sp.]|uniref:nuclear transport factor 2 family protein n=1 Tax=uncultured Jatrophihabitans sp. TaxID=1610747 RepID=UPI0035CC85F2
MAVRAEIAAGRAADVPALFFAADAVVVVQGAPHVPFVGVFVGLEEISRFFGHLETAKAELLQVDASLIDGDNVVTIGSYRYLVPATGARYRGGFALHTVIRDGKITRWAMYEDSWAVAQAFDATPHTDGT